jgi:hypothetical protein
MSAGQIPNRCWMAAVSLVVLLLIGFGCGPSPFQKQLSQWQDSTKKQHKAADVQAALAPFFADERMLTNPLPKEVTSLPIFDDPIDIRIAAVTTNNNVLTIFTGGGFGHWGIIVARPGHDSEIPRELRHRLTPWEDGVYFYDGE